MPGITKHHSANSTKLLLIGESGTGKTGALASLITAGYKLRIIDLDNGVDILRSYLTDPRSPYMPAIRDKHIDVDEACQVVTFTEKMKSVNGRVLPASAKVWTSVANQLYRWKDKDADGKEIDLGTPALWDASYIVVLDSLTFLSDSAMNFQQAMNGQLGTDASSKGYEMRTDIRLAQAQIAKLLGWLYDEDFKPNVIVTAHINFRMPEGQTPDSSMGKRGYPQSVGAALAPRIPRWFNNTLQTITEGVGQSEKHKISTVSWGGVSAKTSAPSRVKPFYNIENGLAEFFHDVQEIPG